jgi:hypothetical protein
MRMVLEAEWARGSSQAANRSRVPRKAALTTSRRLVLLISPLLELAIAERWPCPSYQ